MNFCPRSFPGDIIFHRVRLLWGTGLALYEKKMKDFPRKKKPTENRTAPIPNVSGLHSLVELALERVYHSRATVTSFS